MFEITNSMTDTTKPIMLHIQPGSVTPRASSAKNPSYMTLDLDAKTLLPINMDTVYFDLEASNSSGTPTWS